METKMHKYDVTFDVLYGKRYHEVHETVVAKNAKEACSHIKEDYWTRVNRFAEIRRISTSTARQYFRYPFHITAKRAD